MDIKVKTITGRTEIILANSLLDLQKGIENTMGIEISSQKILCNGKLASDSNLASEAMLIISLEGGAKGKKKKQTQKKTKKKTHT